MIDTHCHLSIHDYDNVDSIVKNMGDNIMIDSGASMEMNKEVLDIISKYSNVYGTIGFHPEELAYYDLQWLENNLHIQKIVGLGEIGLDYHHGKDTRIEQKKAFKEQLELAYKSNLPVVIHSRDAAQDTLDILKKYNGTIVMHCYSYSLEIAQELLKKDAYFGIGGVVTFKNAKSLINVVQNVPLNRLLLETDSPYLTPEPLRGTKNEPRNILYVAKKIAEIKNVSVDEVLQQTTINAKKVFKFYQKRD